MLSPFTLVLFRMASRLHFPESAIMEKAQKIAIAVIREWDATEFHRKVLELESRGWVAARDTYKITAEMHPETGIVTHLHAIELRKTTDE